MEQSDPVYYCIGCWFDGATDEDKTRHERDTERLGISSETPHSYHEAGFCKLVGGDPVDDAGKPK